MNERLANVSSLPSSLCAPDGLSCQGQRLFVSRMKPKAFFLRVGFQLDELVAQHMVLTSIQQAV